MGKNSRGTEETNPNIEKGKVVLLSFFSGDQNSEVKRGKPLGETNFLGNPNDVTLDNPS